ncbi:polysaccharide deacetylase family protein [Pseudarthrobacter sp. SSS035]|uniref:polysaccharide deacetylase family protein n=1 Tax=Pseudarthrobacter sp. SSS035 TaxID=2931399 RepID=UPI002010225F|nr:polysaccharide deacetylase family protein [Pseudarthrobacter sp. SSS035]
MELSSFTERFGRPRDFAGYGENPPTSHWPESGARVAVSLVINIEDGAERSLSRGDAADDVNAHWITDLAHERGNPSLESGFDYGARAGFWRVLRITDAARVPVTAFACGRALDLNPHIARALSARMIEIVDHGLLWEPHGSLSLPELTARMDASARIIAASTAGLPTSWYSKDGHSAASLGVMNDRGFAHDSNCFSEDMPYVPDGPHGLVTIPYAADTNDSMLVSAIATGSQFSWQLLAALESLLEDDRPGAKVLSIGLHPRWIGRPAYAGALQRFIARALDIPDVVFAERRQIAAWWRSMHAQK